MKTARDPRHKKREKIVEDLFKASFHKQPIGDLARQIIDNKDFLDEQIKKAAPQFPIDKINRTDLAVLRLAVYELLIDKKQPPKVIIDEAIELSKQYGGETSPAFVNGALGNIIKDVRSTGSGHSE